MAGTDKTELGDRMKSYEAPSTFRRAFKGQPLIVRLDGKSFHTFTKGLQRPYDSRLSALMVDTTKALVDRFQARVGYTQSDEITLAWHVQPHETAEYPFNGRFQKLESLTAAFTTAYFNRQLPAVLPEKGAALPIFDSRAFVVPTIEEAYHVFLWRQQDATKNAISMAAHTYFSHRSLQGAHGPEMQERLFKEKGINFNDYPSFFRRGTFVKRQKVVKPIDSELVNKLTAKGVPVPTGPIERTVLTVFDCWLSREEDPVSILFGDGMPQVTPENAEKQENRGHNLKPE
jgi:tRNA(His) 5'-end guanylyltransferase